MELTPAPEQRVYARILAACARLGFVLLVAGFVLYATGILAPQVPIAQLPALWGLSAGEFQARAGIPEGWGWTTLLARGDMLNLVPIAWLASCSAVCLAAVLPAFQARGDRAYVVLAVVQIAVLALAALGVMLAGH